MIELVVFDIAGTTVADNGNINEVFRTSFENAGITNVDPTDVNRLMGYRKKEAIRRIVAQYKPGMENDEALVEAIHEDFCNRMIGYYETTGDLRPLPFAENVFNELRSNDIKVALNTGFTRSITAPVLRRLGWDHSPLVQEVICSDEVPQGRPHPFMIEELMRRLGVVAAVNVAKVGDTTVDIQEGQNAGCGVVIAVTTGACTREELMTCQPDYVIGSLDLVPSLIL